MPNKKQDYSYKRQRLYRSKGTAIMETAVGICVLIPVLFLLLDILSLVIGQTINDDLAKSAARAAVQMTTASDGLNAANSYLDSTLYRGGSMLVSQAQITNFNWDDKINNSCSVTTQVTINLPIAVPFGGPKQQVMVAQASEALIAITAKPPGGP